MRARRRGWSGRSSGEGTVWDGVPAIYARIVKACLVAGLRPSDAEDVAQDIWLWLLHSGRQSEALVTPWLGAVAQNFIRRYWRGRKRRSARENQAVAETSALHLVDGTEALDSRLSLDRMEAQLPATEAKLLHLVRRGCSFAQAIQELHIPRGSRSYFRKRLIAHLAEGLRAPKREQPGGAKPKP
jgi:DNA-directed RNA polymerase specialized sigma24 family protein